MPKPRRHKSGEPNPPDSANDAGMPPDSDDNADRLSGDSSERIAARAYELYLARGGSDGQDFDDWLTAERELSSGPSQTTGSTPDTPRGDRSE
jgi:hypothetical protein